MDHFRTRNAAHLQPCNLEEAKRRHENFVVELRKQARTDRFLQKKARLAKNKGGEFEKQLAALTDSYPTLGQADLSPAERNQHLFNSFKSCTDPTLEKKLLAVIRKVMAMQDAPLSICAQTGVIRKLVGMLNASDEETVVAAAWTLTNLASMPEDSVMQLLADAEVPRKFTEMLTRRSLKVQENCLWGLANYAGGETHRRDQLLALGILDAVKPLVLGIQSVYADVSRTLCWLLGNLARNRPDASYSPLFCSLLPHILQTTNDSALEEALQCIFHLTERDQEWLSAVVESGAVGTVCGLLSHKEQSVQFQALRVLGNVCSGTNEHTDIALRCGLLDKLQNLMECQQKTMKKEALWAISNVLASDPKHVEATLKHQVFGAVLRALRDAEIMVRREAVFCIANLACARTPLSVTALFDLHGLEPLCESLSLPDPRLQKAVLDTLLSFLDVIQSHPPVTSLRVSDVAMRLESAGTAVLLENLYAHDNPIIRQLAARVITKLGAEDCENVEDRRTEDGFQYNYRFS